MIARLWKARTKPEMGASYLDYFRRTGLKDFLATPGFRGAHVFRRQAGTASDYVILSFWDDFEAVRRFAGPETDRAVYYAGDVEYFPVDELSAMLDHFDVVLTQGVAEGDEPGGAAESARLTLPTATAGGLGSARRP